MPRIAVVALGGTIAARVDEAGGNATLDVDAAALVAAVPALSSVADLTAVTFRSTMSADLTFDDLADLAEEIRRLSGSGFDGVVVTQGTDTLEENAYLLDLVLAVPVPVVVTGAMRNAGRAGADGPANLLAAVRVAASPLARAVGVLVVLNDEIHLARFAAKLDTSSPAAFGSPGYGPVGRVTEDRVRMPLVPRRVSPVVPAGAWTSGARVALLRLSLSDGDDLIAAVRHLAYDGTVVETYGAGHAGRRSLAALTDLAHTMPTVFVSRTGAGELYRHTGSYPGSEHDLVARGLVPGGALSGLKARILLTVLLGAGATRTGIAEAFEAASS